MKDSEFATIKKCLDAIIYQLRLQNEILCRVHKKKLPKSIVRRFFPEDGDDYEDDDIH